MKKIIAIACAALTPCLAQATVIVFSDNFNSQVAVLNANPTSWTVSGSGKSPTIDVVASGTYGITCKGGSGKCVDLDGSTNNAGTLSKILSLTGGVTYEALFDLSGNQRGYAADIVDIAFGAATQSLTFKSSDVWAGFGIFFTPTTSGNYGLSFHNRGGDNVGALLDNVVVQAVPEPETYVLMISGLGLLGFIGRRRKQSEPST